MKEVCPKEPGWPGLWNYPESHQPGPAKFLKDNGNALQVCLASGALDILCNLYCRRGWARDMAHASLFQTPSSQHLGCPWCSSQRDK